MTACATVCCASLVGLVLSFIACFILLVIAHLVSYTAALATATDDGRGHRCRAKQT